MIIYCCGCESDVDACLTDGSEIYPHRTDLADLPFWKCNKCKNFVGCHHKTKQRTKPLDVIPTHEMKKARQAIHRLLDPLWESGRIGRKQIYAAIAKEIGHEYHTAEIRTIDEARKIYHLIKEIKDGL